MLIIILNETNEYLLLVIVIIVILVRMIPLFLLVLIEYIPNKMNGDKVEVWDEYTGPNRCCKLTGYQTAL